MSCSWLYSQSQNIIICCIVWQNSVNSYRQLRTVQLRADQYSQRSTQINIRRTAILNWNNIKLPVYLTSSLQSVLTLMLTHHVRIHIVNENIWQLMHFFWLIDWLIDHRSIDGLIDWLIDNVLCSDVAMFISNCPVCLADSITSGRVLSIQIRKLHSSSTSAAHVRSQSLRSHDHETAESHRLVVTLHSLPSNTVHWSFVCLDTALFADVTMLVTIAHNCHYLYV